MCIDATIFNDNNMLSKLLPPGADKRFGLHGGQDKEHLSQIVGQNVFSKMVQCDPLLLGWWAYKVQHIRDNLNLETIVFEDGDTPKEILYKSIISLAFVHRSIVNYLLLLKTAC